jgi:predicted lipid carrier protein YhbT
VNNRETKTVVGQAFVKRKWKDIKVGDMVQITNNEFVTVRVHFQAQVHVNVKNERMDLLLLTGRSCCSIYE